MPSPAVRTSARPAEMYFTAGPNYGSVGLFSYFDRGKKRITFRYKNSGVARTLSASAHLASASNEVKSIA